MCLLDFKHSIKQVFVKRLVNFVNNPQACKGFFPDLFRIIGKYNMNSFLKTYLNDGIFPSSTQWKTIIKRSLNNYVEKSWISRLQTDPNLNSFIAIHNKYTPCSLWKFAQIYPQYKRGCTSAMTAISKYFSEKYVTQCTGCNIVTDSLTLHLVMFCKCHEKNRLKLWMKLSNILGVPMFNLLSDLLLEEQLLNLLHGFISFDMTDSERVNALKCCLIFISCIFY